MFEFILIYNRDENVKILGVFHIYLFQDVIQNANIKLDWDFKVSLLTDLVRVSC